MKIFVKNVLDLFVLKIERIFEELYINAAQTFAEIDCLYEQLDNLLNVEEFGDLFYTGSITFKIYLECFEITTRILMGKKKSQKD